MTPPSDDVFEPPTIYRARLTPEDVDALLGDIATCAVVQEIRCRDIGDPAGTRTLESLNEMLELIRSKSIRGLQIRYLHDNTLWFDTLMFEAEGNVELTRIEQPA